MAAVRYVALIALVFWTGLMAGTLFADLFAHTTLVALGCAGTVLVALLVMKFVGPPPRAFFVRAGITALMLVLAAGAALRPSIAPTVVALNFALALILLFWYVRE